MRWRGQVPEYQEGEYESSEFLTAAGVHGDDEGVRAILVNYRDPGTYVYQFAIDPDGEERDVVVLVPTAFLGILRIRKLGDVAWTPITNLIATTFKLPKITVAQNVEVEVTVGTNVLQEIPARLLWNLPGTL